VLVAGTGGTEREWRTAQALLRGDFLEWSGGRQVLADPGTVIESDREVYATGWRWCLCYAACEPQGACGVLPAEILLPVSQAELDGARAELLPGSASSERALVVRLERVARSLV
jgi:hypothetical protein